MAPTQFLLVALLGMAMVVGCAPPGSVSQAPASGGSQATFTKKQIVIIARGEPYTLNRAISDNQPGAIAGISELTYLLNTRLADVQDRQKVVGTRLSDFTTASRSLFPQSVGDARSVEHGRL